MKTTTATLIALVLSASLVTADEPAVPVLLDVQRIWDRAPFLSADRFSFWSQDPF